MGFFGSLFSALFGGGSGGSVEAQLLEQKKQALQSEVDVMAQEANARLEDLRANELEQSPSYAWWVRNGRVAFGVKGKTYQEVQSEFWRIKNFLDSKTSTVEGAKDVLAKISSLVGVSTQMTASETSNYFSLAEKIKEYYKNSGESAKALDYQAIWEVVNIAIEKGTVTLDKNDYTVHDIENILKEIEQTENDIEMAKAMQDDIVKGGSMGGSILGAIGSFFKSLFGGLFR